MSRQLIRNQSFSLRLSVYVSRFITTYPISSSLLRSNTIYDKFSLDLKFQIDFKQFSGIYLHTTSLSRIIRYFRSCLDYIPISPPFIFGKIYAYFQTPFDSIKFWSVCHASRHFCLGRLNTLHLRHSTFQVGIIMLYVEVSMPIYMAYILTSTCSL